MPGKYHARRRRRPSSPVLSFRLLIALIAIAGLLSFSLSGTAGSDQTRILDIRSLSAPQHMAQIVFDLSEPVTYKLFTLQPEDDKPHRVVIDLENARLVRGFEGDYPQMITSLRSAPQQSGKNLRVVLDVNGPVKTKDLLLPPSGRYGHRLVLTLEDAVQMAYSNMRLTPQAAIMPPATPTQRPRSTTVTAQPVRSSQSIAVASAVTTQPVSGGAHYNPPPLTKQSVSSPRARPARSVAQTQQSYRPNSVPQPAVRQPPVRTLPPAARALAAPSVAHKQPLPMTRKRTLIIAIDAGHGGIDPGAVGPRGTYEKNVALAISRELARKINQQAGIQAVLTRDGDYFLHLRERIARARNYKADIFISIHADALETNSDTRGASVYMLSQNGASSEAAQWLAQRENRVDLLGGANSVSLNDKSDVLASILLDLSQTGTLEASSHLGNSVLSALGQVGTVHHRQVQQAAFMVLRSPDIPSILIETAFISNPHEESRLSNPTEQRRIANAIFIGLKDYFIHHAPPGTLLAQK